VQCAATWAGGPAAPAAVDGWCCCVVRVVGIRPAGLIQHTDLLTVAGRTGAGGPLFGCAVFFFFLCSVFLVGCAGSALLG